MSGTPSAANAAERNGKILDKPGKILPRGGTIGRPLQTVMAIMCYLASLSLGSALAVNRISENWTSDLAGQITVTVKPQRGVSVDQQVDDALAVLETTKGVLRARAASDGELKSLLTPYLGSNFDLDRLPVPKLIFVQIDTTNEPDFEVLQQRLTEASPGVLVDDHSRWNTQLQSFATGLASVGFAVLALTTIATIATVIYATRAGLLANRETIEVLHMVGAQDRFIAGEFQNHFWSLGLVAGFIGLIAAAITFYGFASLTETPTSLLTPDFSPSALELASLIAIPIVASIVSMLTARLTALNVIGKMP